MFAITSNIARTDEWHPLTSAARARLARFRNAPASHPPAAGFTLIEIMIVVAIMGIVMTMSMPMVL